MLEKHYLDVFIVDDSELLCMELTTIVSKLENVRVVGTAADVEAWRSILEAQPDVVILDIQLEGGSGIDVLREIREELPMCKIIVLTNFPTTQHRTRCLGLGANHFLDKYRDFGKIAGLLHSYRIA